jgi:hypothetical protein
MMSKLYSESLAQGGASSIFRALATNESLSELLFGVCPEFLVPDDQRFTQDDIQGLGFGLMHNACLRELHLPANFAEGTDLSPFTKALAHNKQLSSLYLSCNPMSNRNAKALAEALSINCSLTTLDISYMESTHEGYLSLCKGLAVNTCLMELTVGWTRHENHEEAMTHLLKHNTTLRKLHMTPGSGFCSCCPKGWQCKSIVDAMMYNSTLTTLTLGHIKGDMLMAIAHVLQKNFTLKILNTKLGYAYDTSAECEAVCSGQGQDPPLLVVKALQDYPRFHHLNLRLDLDIASKALESIGLSHVLSTTSHSEYMGVPVAEYIRQRHVDKIMAFAMAQHVRLGAVSAVRQLGQDCANMVMMAFFSLPLDYVATSAYAGSWLFF